MDTMDFQSKIQSMHIENKYHWGHSLHAKFDAFFTNCIRQLPNPLFTNVCLFVYKHICLSTLM